MSMKSMLFAVAVGVCGLSLAGCVDSGAYYDGYDGGYYDPYYGGPYYGGVAVYSGGHYRPRDYRHYRDYRNHHRRPDNGRPPKGSWNKPGGPWTNPGGKPPRRPSAGKGPFDVRPNQPPRRPQVAQPGPGPASSVNKGRPFKRVVPAPNWE